MKLALLVAVSALTSAASASEIITADVCVYTATASGIQAALAANRAGRSVVLIEPSRWVGGMLGAGIKPTQDCPNINAVGGSTRRLLQTLGGASQGKTNREMSPADLRRDFLALLQASSVRVIYDHRISRCVKEGTRLTAAIFERAPFDDLGCPPEAAQTGDALRVTARIFIDASYEGDLLFRSGASYRLGRESAGDWGESAAGVRMPSEVTPIDPYVEPGRPESGLLPGIEPDHGRPIGAGDQYTQAYNFRFYLTDQPEFREPLTPPDDYDPRNFELVGRYVEFLRRQYPVSKELRERLSRIFPGWRNSGEYNFQRNSLVTNAPLGVSHLLAGGDYATKARIWKLHRDYLRGLHHFLSTDPRVPADFRRYVADLGLDRRPHPETHGWPHQLYIRVARRLVGVYTITQDDIYNRTQIPDPIGLAQYGIDTYPARRIPLARNGRMHVALEGWMFVGGAQGPTHVPYPIPYRAITPRRHECTNLLVPVCFSATHIGYASARMEPVFMICGESAGVAADQALAEGVAVQDINVPRFLARLRELGQILAWPRE